ncbi:MAG: hypothetical protein MUE52_13235 [Tabrizicola sp.]|jgi:hypothetical protein|nr:hypothetical protein [Tabrizicola sp.]
MQVAFFGFICFLYYKILSSFMFSVSISALACLLVSVFSVVIAVILGILLSPKIRSLSLEALRRQSVGDPDLSNFAFENTVVIFGAAILGFAAANFTLGFLIIHGFSADFTKEVLRGPYSRLSPSGLTSLAIILTTPGVFFYLPQAFRTYRAIASKT